MVLAVRIDAGENVADNRNFGAEAGNPLQDKTLKRIERIISGTGVQKRELDLLGESIGLIERFHGSHGPEERKMVILGTRKEAMQNTIRTIEGHRYEKDDDFVERVYLGEFDNILRNMCYRW